jgi:hypothetical protein
VANATWRVTTRIEAGVGDLVWRIGNDQAQVRYSVAGWSRGRVTSYAIHIIHVEQTRSACFFSLASKPVGMVCQWFDLKTKVNGLMICASKSLWWFLGLSLKTKWEKVYQFTPQNRWADEDGVFIGKQVRLGFPSFASKLVEEQQWMVHVALSWRLHRGEAKRWSVQWYWVRRGGS